LDISTKKGNPAKYVPFLCGTMDSDARGNLHLIHRYFDGRYFQLYYNFFNAGDNLWGPLVSLTDDDCNCGIPTMLIDSQDNIHLLWSTLRAGKFRLNYRQKSGDWQQQIILSENNVAMESPVLLPGKEGIAACWHENGRIFCRLLNDGSSMNGEYLWNCPEGTPAIKINSCICATGSEAVIPLTLARKENDYYVIHFDTACLPDKISYPVDDNILDVDTYPEDQQGQTSEETDDFTLEEPVLDQIQNDSNDSEIILNYSNQHAEKNDMDAKLSISAAESRIITWKM
jgi:hypothetical protein